MKVTRLCKTLNINYPLIQAPMAMVATAELAAAVSAAGGLGTLGPNAGLKEPNRDPKVVGEALRQQIKQIREHTANPFAVNLPIGRRGKAVSDYRVEVALQEKIPVAVVSMGSPQEYTSRLKKAGIKVIHAVSTVSQAITAEKFGVDAVVAEGYEAGGHTGLEELTTFVLVPQIADAIKIPVIAAGGIVDVRGVIAAIALGADGVYMGTRFMVTGECPVNPAVKNAIIEAGDIATVAYGRRAYTITRALKNEFTRQYLEKESSGVTPDDLRAFDRWVDLTKNQKQRYEAAVIDGDLVQGSVCCGAAAGLIKSIKSTAEIINEIVSSYDSIVSRLN